MKIYIVSETQFLIKGNGLHKAHVTPDSIKGSLPMWQVFRPFVNYSGLSHILDVIKLDVIR